MYIRTTRRLLAPVLLASSVVVASATSTSAAPPVNHGITAIKGCVSPTAIGQPYECFYVISQNVSGDTATITDIDDNVAAAGSAPTGIDSGNVLSKLILTLSGGAACNGAQTSCSIPDGGSISTAEYSFYTVQPADYTLPGHVLSDEVTVTYSETCTGPGAGNCPIGPQETKPGSSTLVLPPSARYVALGDSFSSGEGNPPYFEPKNACHRSMEAYPAQIDVPGTEQPFEGAVGYGWGFLACSGDTTKQILDTQVTTKPEKHDTNWLALSASTSLVTITAGGDDLHWPNILMFCYKKWTNCENDAYPKSGDGTLNAYVATELSTLEANLVPLYQKIRGMAPNATILVLGYPQLLPATPAEQDCAVLQPTKHLLHLYGLDNDEQNWIRGEDTNLNSTIATAVADSGVNATFVPVAGQGEFAGHEVCGSQGEWINGPSLTLTDHWIPITPRTTSFHPNQLGQDEYATIINQLLDGAQSQASPTTGALKFER